MIARLVAYRNYWPLLGLPILALIYWQMNQEAIQTNLPLILGLMALPMTIRKTVAKPNWHLPVLLSVLIVLLHLTSSNTLHYLFTAFVILFLIERTLGKQNILPVLLILVVSPAVSNILNIWSFPIRMNMTSLAGSIIQGMGSPIEVMGNTIRYNGNEFAVDPECMGLRLLTSSLVSVIAVLGFHVSHRYRLSAFEAVLWLILALGLSIFANFSRLLVLILFHILPENPMHDAVGLLCLIIYTIVPLVILIRIRKRYWKKVPEITLDETVHRNTMASGLWLILMIGIQVETGMVQPTSCRDLTPASITLQGFEKSMLDDGIIKLSNDDALIYIKPATSFFQGSHDPRYCWRGSGYQFRKSQLVDQNDLVIFRAQLQNERDSSTLYTAWWYQSKEDITPHDWEWRWNQISSNRKYQLINVTSTSKAKMEEACSEISSRLKRDIK